VEIRVGRWLSLIKRLRAGASIIVFYGKTFVCYERINKGNFDSKSRAKPAAGAAE